MVKVSGEKTDIMRCPASKQKRVSFKSSEPSKNGQDKTEIHVLLLLWPRPNSMQTYILVYTSDLTHLDHDVQIQTTSMHGLVL